MNKNYTDTEFSRVNKDISNIGYQQHSIFEGEMTFESRILAPNPKKCKVIENIFKHKKPQGLLNCVSQMKKIYI